jgi:hypothetical protein
MRSSIGLVSSPDFDRRRTGFTACGSMPGSIRPVIRRWSEVLGMAGAVALVQAMLEARMPAKVDELRARFAASPAALPQVKTFRPVTVGKAAAGDYPVLYVVGNGMGVAKPLQKAAAGVQYSFSYQLTVVTLVRSTSDRATTLLQQRLAQAVTECLLQSQQLAPIGGDDSARVESDSLRMRFSGIEAYGRDLSTYGGCMTDVSVTGQEFLPRLVAPVGPLQRVVVGPAFPVGPTQPFPP